MDESPELLLEFSKAADENLAPPDALPSSLKFVLCADGATLYQKTLDISKALLAGLDFATACLQAGGTPEEINSLMRAYPPVARALNFAHACCKAWWIEKLAKAADKGDWKAAAFFLERRYPTSFAEVKAVARRDLPPANSDVTATAREMDVSKLSDDELMALSQDSAECS